MSIFDLQRVLESKRALRRKLAARPLTEKLHLLDELRERALAIPRASQTNRSSTGSGIVNENATRYGDKGPT